MTLQWSKLKTVNFDTSIKKIEYQDYIQIIHMKVIDKVNWQKNTMKIKKIKRSLSWKFHNFPLCLQQICQVPWDLHIGKYKDKKNLKIDMKNGS